MYKNGNSKIVNLINDSDNESSTRKWYIINDQNNGRGSGRGNMGEDMKMIQQLNLRQMLLNQIFVIFQTHVFL